MDTNNLSSVLSGGGGDNGDDFAPATYSPQGTPMVPAGGDGITDAGAPAKPAPGELWKNTLTGALYGLAGSAGATSFGGGLAAGAGGFIQGKQQELTNAQRAQQLRFESAAAADSHTQAFNEARAADDAHENHQIARQQYADNVKAYAKVFGDNPDLEVRGQSDAETHAAAVGGLHTLAGQKDGIIPAVSTVSSPLAGERDTHVTTVWAKPTAKDLTQNPIGNLQLVNEYRKLHNMQPLSRSAWSTADGNVPDLGPANGQETLNTIWYKAAFKRWRLCDQGDGLGSPRSRRSMCGVVGERGRRCMRSGVLLASTISPFVV